MDKTVGTQVNSVDRVDNPTDNLREYIIVNSKNKYFRSPCLVGAVSNPDRFRFIGMLVS